MFRIDNARTLQTISNQDKAIRTISTAIEELKLSMKSFMDDLRKSALEIPGPLIDFITQRWSLNEMGSTHQNDTTEQIESTPQAPAYSLA